MIGEQEEAEQQVDGGGIGERISTLLTGVDVEDAQAMNHRCDIGIAAKQDGDGSVGGLAMQLRDMTRRHTDQIFGILILRWIGPVTGIF
jgi:hypothetical protein